MLYEVLKTAKMGAGQAPDLYTALLAKNLRRDGEVKTLSGIPPLAFRSNGQPLLDYLISGNTVQSGTPTPENPIIPEGCGDLETVGDKTGQYKIPISSANTTTNICLGEVETTRKIRKLVLTGEETIRLQSINEYNIANFYINIASVAKDGLSSHLEKQNTIISQTQTEGFLLSASGTSTTLYMRISTSRASTTTELQTWLSNQYTNGTPVTFWYTTEDTTTGIVNEPLRKIGDYADTLSMEQAGMQILTARGTNTLDVLTDVKPSEVYIKYKS